MKMLFENAKLGDKVWSFVCGWGEVIAIQFSENTRFNEQRKYANKPLIVEFKRGGRLCYDLCGRMWDHDINPSLFWDEIKITSPERQKRKVKKIIKVGGWHNVIVEQDGTYAFLGDSYYNRPIALSAREDKEPNAVGSPVFIEIDHEWEEEEND